VGEAIAEETGKNLSQHPHSIYMRNWRKTHPLTPEQIFKDNARSYAGVYKRRGKLIPNACKCGEIDVEMHHSDYSQPLAVEWICRSCHLLFHMEQIK